MREDITDILAEWPYDGEHTVRIIEGLDGRQLLQVRLPLGIEQYEMDGRPDGETVGPEETFLDHILLRLEERGQADFSITHEEFLHLQSESVMYYYRYIILFQLGDYTRTVRDTDHNLKACELVERFGAEEKDRDSFLQYKPYILRINSVSRAMMKMEKKDYESAEEILKNAVSAVTDMDDVDTVVFKIEKVRSLRQLKSLLSQVQSKETDPTAALEIELKEAVEAEDYEHAAELRDMIRERARRSKGGDY